MRKIDKKIWINKAIANINEDNHDKVIVTDIRKVEERKALEYSYGNISNIFIICDEDISKARIEKRDGVGESKKSDCSEEALKSMSGTRIYNNYETLEDFYNDIDRIMYEQFRLESDKM